MQSDCLVLEPLLEMVVVAVREAAPGAEVSELVEHSGQRSGQLALRGALLQLPTPTELPTGPHCLNSDSTMTNCVRLATHWK